MISRIIFSDIDGTLLNSSNKITEATKQAVAKAAEIGIKVVPVSARMPQGVEPISRELEIDDTAVYYGGAMVVDNGVCVLNEVLPHQYAVRCVMAAKNMGIHISLYRENSWIVEKYDKWQKQESEITGLNPDVRPLLSTLDEWKRSGTGANKLLFIASPEAIAALKCRLELEGKDISNLFCSKPTYMEVTSICASKQMAIDFLAGRYGIARKNIMAIGDGENDADMIAYAGFGVAMGNAPEGVKRLADFVTLSNDDDGFALAVQKFIRMNQMNP